MVEISYKTLLDSRNALVSLGSLEAHHLPTDEYMNIVNTFEKISNTLSAVSDLFTIEHHALLIAHGKKVTDDNGLEAYAVEPDKQDGFNAAVRDFLARSVTIDIEMIPTGIFEGGQPKLCIADRAALKWLLVERGICNS